MTNPLLQKTLGFATDFLEGLPSRNVDATSRIEDLRKTLGGELPEESMDAEAVIDLLVRQGDSGIVASTGPRFFGFVVGGALPVSLAADWLTVTWDQNAGIYVLSPTASVVEETAARWLLDLLDLPSNASVGFVTGAQMANLTALAAARYEVLRRVGWDVHTEGLNGSPRVHVIAGGDAHITISRALRLLGMGTRMKITDADEQGRMKPDALASVLKSCQGPTIVCAQIGNVNSGAFDPLDSIAELTRKHGAWLHVDGAFGLWARTSGELRSLARGAELADSWAMDAHKWLNVPQDSGLVIVADPAAHRAAMSTDASYIVKSSGSERDPIDWVPEFSRRARGFAVWAALRHLGRSGVRDLMERCCRHARTIAAQLDRSPRVSILNDVVLNQVLARFTPPRGDADEFTRAVIGRIQRDGTCWAGGTTWKGMATMRVSVSNWSTTEEDCIRSAEAMLRCVEEEAAALGS